MHDMVAHFVHHTHDLYKVPLILTPLAKNMFRFVNRLLYLD
jgi:hypothetical protein